MIPRHATDLDSSRWNGYCCSTERALHRLEQYSPEEDREKEPEEAMLHAGMLVWNERVAVGCSQSLIPNSEVLLLIGPIPNPLPKTTTGNFSKFSVPEILN